VFITHNVAIDAPIDVVSARLAHLLNRDALHALSAAAYEGGLETLFRVGPLGPTWGLSRLVRVRTLEPVRRGDKTTITLRWEATGVTGELFPALDAELALVPHGDGHCRLELVGSYRPPFGRAGVAVDRAIMAHVADATIRSLLERAAAFLAAPQAQPHGSPGAAPHWQPLASPE
jgi:hypothetical protein